MSRFTSITLQLKHGPYLPGGYPNTPRHGPYSKIHRKEAPQDDARKAPVLVLWVALPPGPGLGLAPGPCPARVLPDLTENRSRQARGISKKNKRTPARPCSCPRGHIDNRLSLSLTSQIDEIGVVVMVVVQLKDWVLPAPLDRQATCEGIPLPRTLRQLRGYLRGSRCG